MAAGFEIPAENIEQLRQRLLPVAESVIGDIPESPEYIADAEIQLKQLNSGFSNQYKKLEPFGFGNDIPTLASRSVKLAASPKLLKNKHLKLSLIQSGSSPITAMGWNMGDRMTQWRRDTDMDIVFSVLFNRWRDREEMQLVLQDFGESESL
jgi:single-stranded-DNA-specific exonuclease